MSDQTEELDIEEVRRKRLARFDIRQTNVPKDEGSEKESKSDGGGTNPKEQTSGPPVSKDITKLRKSEAPKSSGITKPEGGKSEPKRFNGEIGPQKLTADKDAPEGLAIFGKTYKTQLPDTRLGYLIKKKIPADNSCLFTSIGFLISGVVDSGYYSSLLRQVVVDVIKREKNKYTTQILNRTPESYCEWILKSSSWGGGVEMTILSDHFNIEIAILNCVAGVVTVFGDEKGNQHRGYLLYDGSHYDALYLQLIGTTDEFTGVFPPDACEIYDAASQMAHDISVSPTFTFMKRADKCIFKCQDCNQGDMDRFGMINHAITKGHKNFDLIEGNLDFLEHS